MSDAEKVVAELRARQRAHVGMHGNYYQYSGVDGLLDQHAADLIADQAARLEEAKAETRRVQAAALAHIDEMTAFQRQMVITERERDDAKAALTAAEADKERLRAALERIARWEKHGGEKPRVYPVDIARAALQKKDQTDV